MSTKGIAKVTLGHLEIKFNDKTNGEPKVMDYNKDIEKSKDRENPKDKQNCKFWVFQIA